MTLDDAICTGSLDGYQNCAPSRRCALEDAKIVADWACPHCGTAGLIYRPFSKPGSYRPFAVCRVCGVGEEF